MTLATNRRSLITMSAALAASASASLWPEQTTHLAEFIREADAYNATLPQAEWVNPGAFAETGDSLITQYFDEFGDAVEPDLWANWRQAEAEMLHAFPMLRSGNGTPLNEWERFCEETFAWSLAMFRAGVKRGAVMEHLRREIAPAKVVCWQCAGHGVTAASLRPDSETWELCPTCHGEGTAVPPQTKRSAWYGTDGAR